MMSHARLLALDIETVLNLVDSVIMPAWRQCGVGLFEQ